MEFILGFCLAGFLIDCLWIWKESRKPHFRRIDEIEDEEIWELEVPHNFSGRLFAGKDELILEYEKSEESD